MGGEDEIIWIDACRATLFDGSKSINCPTVQEAVIEWDHLPSARKRSGCDFGRGPSVYRRRNWSSPQRQETCLGIPRSKKPRQSGARWSPVVDQAALHRRRRRQPADRAVRYVAGPGDVNQ